MSTSLFAAFALRLPVRQSVAQEGQTSVGDRGFSVILPFSSGLDLWWDEIREILASYF